MGVYLETVRKFPHIRLPNPPIHCDRKGFLESQSKKLVFGLGGIVMAGVFNIFSERTMSRVWGKDSEKIDLLQFTSDGGRTTARKSIEPKITSLLSIIPALIPQEEREITRLIDKPLTLLGLMSLGILCVNYPDMIGEAAIRFSALSYIFKYDKVAELLYAAYPEVFDGFKTVDALIDNMTGRISISNSNLKEIYKMCNLPKK